MVQKDVAVQECGRHIGSSADRITGRVRLGALVSFSRSIAGSPQDKHHELFEPF